MISIHRIVLRRLVAAWLIVSFLIGSVAYYIEAEKIDDAIVALAASQATEFAPEGLDTGKRSPAELAKLSAQAESFMIVKKSALLKQSIPNTSILRIN